MNITEIRDILHRETCSCVVAKVEGEVRLFHRRGVIDLFELLRDEPEALRDALIADKVIGRAAAAIMVVGGVSEVYTDVISRSGLELLSKSSVKHSYNEVIDYIPNRTGDGSCPMESACREVETAEQAVEILRKWEFPIWMKERNLRTDNKIMERTVKLYSLSYTNLRTYLFASLFVVGNVVMPQLAHLTPQGGLTWLPIYFFTLIGAYKYGWRVGLLTAVASPLVNHLLFGMPPAAMLPVILLKSTLLALCAGWVASRFKSISLPLMLAVVLGYQVIGTLGEWALVGELRVALQDFRVGLPGMAVQVIGGYLIIKYLIRR